MDAKECELKYSVVELWRICRENSLQTSGNKRRLCLRLIDAGVLEERIKVVSTGDQAPYGIDEVIETYPNTPAGLKKAIRYALKWWHPPPLVISTTGKRIDLSTGEPCDFEI